MSTVVVLQSYVPSYREPLFDRMYRLLQEEGVCLRVVAGRPTRELKARGDDVGRSPWLDTSNVSEQRILGHQIRWRTDLWSKTVGAGLVVTELNVGNVDSWRLLLSRRKDRKVALWGHVDSFVRDFRRGEAAINASMIRRADHVFAYTERGAQRAARFLPPEQTSTLCNATGSGPLLESHEIANTLQGRVAGRWLFLGGLDAAKRLELVVAAVGAAVEVIDDFELVVAGQGIGAGFLEQAARRGLPIRLVGRADAQEKEVLARECVGILMPGRIGLVAVDALQMGLPIVTTKWAYHGPEEDYLREGVNTVYAEDTGASLAEAMRLVNVDRGLQARLVTGCLESASGLTAKDMATRFVTGILKLVRDDRRAGI